MSELRLKGHPQKLTFCVVSILQNPPDQNGERETTYSPAAAQHVEEPSGVNTEDKDGHHLPTSHASQPTHTPAYRNTSGNTHDHHDQNQQP